MGIGLYLLQTHISVPYPVLIDRYLRD